MQSKYLYLLVLSTLTSACVQDETEPTAVDDDVDLRIADLPADVKATRDYYLVRRDFRKCAYPTCGGWYLAKVNRRRTACPGGGMRDECYVPEFGVPEGIELAGGDLVHGRFGTTQILGLTWGSFSADFVYAPTLVDAQPGRSHDLIYNTGIVCITTPCPSTGLARLNSTWSTTSLELSFAGADADEDGKLEQALWSEYGDNTSEAGGGALTLGDVSRRAGGASYSISNVYVRRVADVPVCVVNAEGNTITAWTFESEKAAQPLLDALTGSVEILAGTCGEQLLACAKLLAPVHGEIDANAGSCETHANACEFRTAVINAAGDGKASGTWADGPC